VRNGIVLFDDNASLCTQNPVTRWSTVERTTTEKAVRTVQMKEEYTRFVSRSLLLMHILIILLMYIPLMRCYVPTTGSSRGISYFMT